MTVHGRDSLFNRILSRQPNNNLLNVKLHKSNFDAFKIQTVVSRKQLKVSPGGNTGGEAPFRRELKRLDRLQQEPALANSKAFGSVHRPSLANALGLTDS